MFKMQEFQQQVDVIVQDYLYSVSSLKNHNHFKKEESADIRKKYYQSHGFGIFNQDNDNYYVVKEEFFLEGCTRVFLINPIMKLLLDSHGIENDWQFGSTFANFNISNREYELGSFLEFIAELDGKKKLVFVILNHHILPKKHTLWIEILPTYLGIPKFPDSISCALLM